MPVPKFILIGQGFISPTHRDAIISIGGMIIDEVGLRNGMNSWKKAIKNPEADYVIILTPNDLHFEMALEAAKQDKIVLVEKPLCLSVFEAEELAKEKNIYTVLQLRYHPLAKKLKQNISIKKFYDIILDVSVYRDKTYYTDWKGQRERSGGILFNLGIHYFDLLIYLFGNVEKGNVNFLDDKTGEGTVKGQNYICRWRINIDEKKDDQRRKFIINGEGYNFSSKDNLAQENLHRYVYEELLKGKGIRAKEALPAINLIETVYGANVLGA